MEQEAERIATEMAERCARLSRGDPAIATELAHTIVAKFLEAVQRDCASPLYAGPDETDA